uniref:CCHC-type domain-containing protein n=1 Tax=Tanacetum cinerariifolium TaxID=118510 RepID=A0A6L2KJ46_TANCI|nr:hypothetical protein [Tanacetum cinerariifolium]
MSSITAQQTKLYLKLVPKEKRLEIRKCNERLNPRKIQREPTFQVVLDALALTPCYSTFLITADVPEVYIRATSPKKARKFKKPASTKLTTVPVSTEAPTGNESGTVTKTTPSVAKIKPSATSKGTGVKPGVPDVAEEESSENEAESLVNDEDDNNNEQVSSDEDSDQEKDSDDDKTHSDNESESDSKHETDESESGLESDHDESEENEEEEDDDEDETKITDKARGDEDEEMNYITSQLYDDMDIRLNEPVDTNKGFVQEEDTDAAMTNVQQGNENLKILQVIEDAHVTLFTVSQKTKVLVTSSSHSSDLATKFLNFLDIPHTDADVLSYRYGKGNVVPAPAEGNGNGINGNPIRCYNCRGEGHYASNCIVKPRKQDAAYLQPKLQIAQEEESGIQSTQEEFEFMAAADAYEETERVKASYILKNNLQQASTSGTQSDKAPVYDSDGSAEVHLSENCYDNDTFSMFSQEDQYTELLEPIPEPHQVPQNDSNVISKASSVEQGGGTVEQHPTNVKETHMLYDSFIII